MIRSEDKMKAILPYMVKRAARIKGASAVFSNKRPSANAIVCGNNLNSWPNRRNW